MIPYGKQLIDDDDIQAVVEVLRSDFLTQGPKVAEFEEAFAERVGATYAVAVNSGTAALHACMVALGIGPGDEVIVPPITFTATANCVLFVGGTPVFADVLPGSLTIDPDSVAAKITDKTRAIIAVDYAGGPCEWDKITELARKHNIATIADSCHALGASYRGRPAGSLADLNTFSFHPVKHIATGEGGMVTTDHADLAGVIRDLRTHGITRDADRFQGLGGGDSDAALNEKGPWYYEMLELGFNYRISDINCALGLSQLGKLDVFVERRREIAARYGDALEDVSEIALPVSHCTQPALEKEGTLHAFHLYPVQVDFQAAGKSRSDVMEQLREKGVGTQVHYIPVYLQPYYRRHLGFKPGLCPVAEAAYARLLSLPMYPAMTNDDVDSVVSALKAVLS